MPNNLNKSESYHKYLVDGGEMGELIRNYNWSANQLGHPSTWSQSLLTTLSIILKSKFPMFLWWGPDLIQFYNDAYRPSLGNSGKHPRALGQKGEECWPEIWRVIKPMIYQVLTGGDAVWHEDSLIPIFRNGKLEDVYWTFCYSQVNDHTGGSGGVLVTCYETTAKIKSEIQIYETLTRLAEREARLRYMLADAPVAIAVLKGRELIIETANDKVLEVWGKTVDVIGKPLHIAIPELKGQDFLQILDLVFSTGQPYQGKEEKAILERSAKLQEVYFNFVYHPLKNSHGETTSIMIVANDITEQVNARRQVENSEKRFKALINAISQIAMTNTPGGEMNYFNRRWYDYTGLSEKDLYKGRWLKAIHQDDLLETIKKYDAIRSGVEGGEFENRYLRADGVYRWHLNRMEPLKESGLIGLWVVTATDIHDLKLLQQQKEDFISIASHELKTPITGLTGYVQLLSKMKTQVPENMRGLIEKAAKSLEKVNILVQDLLNASKLTHGQLYLKKNKFNLITAVQERCHDIDIDKHFIVTIIGEESLWVFADSERIGQVVTNFINNAKKYAYNSKKIRILIEKINSKVKVSVTDFGPGIPTERLPHLFERYYKADESGAQYSGLGLGLYISAEIIKKHCGEIGVESKIGKGSTFWFTIPLKEISLDRC
ncbi:PAS domain-containing sensor histidine kinase [Pedobacter gandavensis]|uniref:PAS domain-containing sensor histidine kinase n=1 Tax=Pedobacter gandavensis TaxID=2679963 RepID=UPI00247A9955|nr:PAS domain-containing sensor histidine kinase [Pedobacter gandavensis]WGQ10662.1 PAS domain-containing sensor histidine kinase [Pedobacter gandavensis]